VNRDIDESYESCTVDWQNRVNECNGDISTTESPIGSESLNLSAQFTLWNHFPSNVPIL